MTVHGTATVMNEAGIHCRPSTHIVKSMKDYDGRIRVSNEAGESDLTSMLDLMMMALTCGTTVDVEVAGPDEEAVLKKTVQLFEQIYDFPDAGE